ncbi:MAG: dihydroorotate dehydrogenase electron transfer subunit [Acidobacteriota bacterium]
MPAPVDASARVLANTRLSADYNVVAFDAPELAAVTQPGQFVMIRTAAGTDPLLRRPFSVFEVVRDGTGAPAGFSILSKRVGPGTARLYDASAGDRFSCLGPLGRPFSLLSPASEAWMIAGGVGLAPFVLLADALRARDVGVTLFYGGRRSEDLLYLDWFASRRVSLVLATEDGSRGTAGLVTAPLEAALSSAGSGRDVMLYACGPEPMLKTVASLAQRFDRRVELSVERMMGCGMGGCYSCVVRVLDEDGRARYVRSCLAGPVMDGKVIVWE